MSGETRERCFLSRERQKWESKSSFSFSKCCHGLSSLVPFQQKTSQTGPHTYIRGQRGEIGVKETERQREEALKWRRGRGKIRERTESCGEFSGVGVGVIARGRKKKSPLCPLGQQKIGILAVSFSFRCVYGCSLVWRSLCGKRAHQLNFW